MIRLENVLKISLHDVLKTSWRCLEGVSQDVLKTFWKRLQNVLKTSWKRLEDVLKTYSQDECIGLDQDVFWRRKAKANIFVLIKTSSEDEDEKRLQDVFKTSSSRRMFAGLIVIDCKYALPCLINFVFQSSFQLQSLSPSSKNSQYQTLFF